MPSRAFIHSTQSLSSLNPNHEIEIHDFASSSHSWTLHKIIAEPMGATARRKCPWGTNFIQTPQIRA